MKKIVCFMLVICMLSVPVFAADSIRVVLNGTEVSFPDVEPCLISNRTMVPMRAIFEALGAGVYWDETSQMIFSMKGETTVTMQIDNPSVFVNDKTVTLDVPPCLAGNRTMVPLRAVSESFGLKVQWDDATQTVFITGE